MAEEKYKTLIHNTRNEAYVRFYNSLRKYGKNNIITITSDDLYNLLIELQEDTN